MNLDSLSVDDLARQCSEETSRFRRGDSFEPRHCFELLRRALSGGRMDAFTSVYHIFQPQVLRWVYGHSRFYQTGESAEYFANSALTSFYFALRGDKFNNFAALPQVLSYLKTCVHTAIMQYLRKTPPVDTADIGEEQAAGDVTGFDAGIHASELWDRVCELLPDVRDQTLARGVFVHALKPSQIVEEYPGQWGSPREVSVALQRIRRSLRKDPVLQQWAGVPTSPDE